MRAASDVAGRKGGSVLLSETIRHERRDSIRSSIIAGGDIFFQRMELRFLEEFRVGIRNSVRQIFSRFREKGSGAELWTHVRGIERNLAARRK